MKESGSSNLESGVHMFRPNRNGSSHVVGNVVLENNLKQNGVGVTSIVPKGVDVLSGSKIAGIHQTRNHLGPDIIVSNQGGVTNSRSMMHTVPMHTSTSTMDIKVLQKSNTFSSSLSSGGLKLGSWFDRRARKISMKCSKSMNLGKMFIINLRCEDTLLLLPLNVEFQV